MFTLQLKQNEEVMDEEEEAGEEEEEVGFIMVGARQIFVHMKVHLSVV